MSLQLAKQKHPIEETLERLRKQLSKFNDDEEATTEKHGIWSLKKILVLHDYIKPYLQIVRNNGYKNVHYVDPFSGSGFLKIDRKIMPGTPLIPILSTRELITKNKSWCFDSCYYSDSDKFYISELDKRIKILKNGLPTRFEIEHKMFRTAAYTKFTGAPPLPKNEKDNAYLVVLDPYGFDVYWEYLEQILKSGPVDVILTFPSELANWTKTMSNSQDKLQRMFGGNDFINFESSNEFVERYCEKIEKTPMPWRKKTTAITVDAGKQTYHLICISRSGGALKVFSSMQKKFDDISTEKLQGMFNAATGSGLSSWYA